MRLPEIDRGDTFAHRLLIAFISDFRDAIARRGACRVLP